MPKRLEGKDRDIVLQRIIDAGPESIEQLETIEPISQQETARILKMATSTIKSYVTRGTLTGYKIGHRRYIHPKSIMEMYLHPNPIGRPKVN